MEVNLLIPTKLKRRAHERPKDQDEQSKENIYARKSQNNPMQNFSSLGRIFGLLQLGDDNAHHRP